MRQRSHLGFHFTGLTPKPRAIQKPKEPSKNEVSEALELKTNEPMDLRVASRIVNFNVPIAKCSYSKVSKRGLGVVVKSAKEIIDLCLMMLEGWSKFPSIAVDGQNGTGKSNLTKTLKRQYTKINELAPDITRGPTYNFAVHNAIEYLVYRVNTKAQDNVWDRSAYANLIFYYVHQLMYDFISDIIPDDEDFIFMYLNQFAIATNLLDILDVMEQKQSIPTLIFVCSNTTLVGATILKRGIETNSVNDVYNSKNLNYQKAQYYTYTWFSKIMGWPCFDIVDFINAGYSIDDAHLLIKQKIDITHDAHFQIDAPNRESSLAMKSIMEVMGDSILVYDYSKK